MKRIITSKVAGTTFEGRQDIIAALSGSEPCRLEPHPYDPNAIGVMVATADGVKQVGFIPRDLAKIIAPHLEGENLMVTIAQITGGFETRDGDIAAFGMLLRIELPESDVPQKR